MRPLASETWRRYSTVVSWLKIYNTDLHNTAYQLCIVKNLWLRNGEWNGVRNGEWNGVTAADLG